jgi:hypothetical protein
MSGRILKIMTFLQFKFAQHFVKIYMPGAGAAAKIPSPVLQHTVI